MLLLFHSNLLSLDMLSDKIPQMLSHGFYLNFLKKDPNMKYSPIEYKNLAQKVLKQVRQILLGQIESVQRLLTPFENS
jgi:hypothetical protein